MAKRDYYEVLEVDKTATLDVIKKAYRKKGFLIVDVMCVMSVAPAPVGPGKSPTLTASAKS